MKYHHAMVCWIRINPAERIEQLIITACTFTKARRIENLVGKKEASVTHAKCFVIIFPSAPIDKSQESSLRQGLPMRYAAAVDTAIAAAKNFSARPQIILAEREKGDDHVSKSESLARHARQIIGVISRLRIIKDHQFSINI